MNRRNKFVGQFPKQFITLFYNERANPHGRLRIATILHKQDVEGWW